MGEFLRVQNGSRPACLLVFQDGSGFVTETGAWRAAVLPSGDPHDEANGSLRSGADGIAFDDRGHRYVATKLGIQICDQAGREVGIVRNPSRVDPSNLVSGGADLKTQCVTAGDKVYKTAVAEEGRISLGSP